MQETKILPVVRIFVTSSLELFEFISVSVLDHQVVAEIKIFRGYAIFSSTVFQFCRIFYRFCDFKRLQFMEYSKSVHSILQTEIISLTYVFFFVLLGFRWMSQSSVNYSKKELQHHSLCFKCFVLDCGVLMSIGTTVSSLFSCWLLLKLLLSNRQVLPTCSKY